MTRRRFLHGSAAGLAAVGLFGAPGRADAFFAELLAAAITFLRALVVPVAAGLILDALRRQPNFQRPVDNRSPAAVQFHNGQAEQQCTRAVLAPSESIYRGCIIDVNGSIRFGNGDSLGDFHDLNKPEMFRFGRETPASGDTFRLPSDGQLAMRRSLATARAHNLFRATYNLYARQGAAPPLASVRPLYARELFDGDGNRVTGFGVREPTGVNFLIATESALN